MKPEDVEKGRFYRDRAENAPIIYEVVDKTWHWEAYRFGKDQGYVIVDDPSKLPESSGTVKEGFLARIYFVERDLNLETGEVEGGRECVVSPDQLWEPFDEPNADEIERRRDRVRRERLQTIADRVRNLVIDELRDAGVNVDAGRSSIDDDGLVTLAVKVHADELEGR